MYPANLRQFAFAIRNYAGDSDDWFPPTSCYSDATRHSGDWPCNNQFNGGESHIFPNYVANPRVFDGNGFYENTFWPLKDTLTSHALGRKNHEDAAHVATCGMAFAVAVAGRCGADAALLSEPPAGVAGCWRILQALQAGVGGTAPTPAVVREELSQARREQEMTGSVVAER